LFDRSQQQDDRGNGREQSTSARQAAEALFAPKPQRVEPTIREAAPTDEAVRRPRVLAVAAATLPVERSEPEEPTAKPSRKPIIPAAHVARIRAWLRYGVTVAQVGEMYGVAAGEVERVLRIA
jgi:hypothetical protein